MRSLHIEETGRGTVSIVTVQFEELYRDAGVIIPAEELALLLGCSHDQSWWIMLHDFLTCSTNPVVREIGEVSTSSKGLFEKFQLCLALLGKPGLESVKVCQSLRSKLVLGSRLLNAHLSSVEGRLFLQIGAPPVSGSCALVGVVRGSVNVLSDDLVFSHETEHLLDAVDALQVKSASVLANLSKKDLISSSGEDGASVVGRGLVYSSTLHESYLTIPFDDL